MRISLNKLFEKTEDVYIVNLKHIDAAIEYSGTNFVCIAATDYQQLANNHC